MPETTTSVKLPEGAQVLHRQPAVQDADLGLDVALRGGSVRLVRAVGGDAAVEEAQRQGLLQHLPSKLGA